ncbi:MAG: dockerin type I repeat-containing protein, partial [Ruminococcus sp.]|nr:dockerin type I repeat-containing protein [Ruminococcus sp.]
FYEKGTQPDENSGRMYSINGHTTADGLITSPYEWTEDMIIAEDNGNKLYLTADDKYMYIMADIKHNAQKPVWNLRLENNDTDTSYWYYKQSAGWIYYNQGNHDGITLTVNDNIAEFKIAFGDVMGVNAGTSIKSIRVFVQDEAIEGWAKCGDLTSGQCNVPVNIPVYSAPYEIRLAEGETYLAKPEVFVENASYQWYHDGEAIDGAISKEYEVSEAGKYSVVVTVNGLPVEIPVITVDGILKGDINSDGEITVADLVLLEKHILGAGNLTVKQYTVADLTGDKIIDSFDMVMMRKMLV